MSKSGKIAKKAAVKGSSTKRSATDSSQGDLLRDAINWVFDDDAIFDNLEKHGNANWTAKYLVILAVLTCWSDAQQLTSAFKKASKLSHQFYHCVAVGTFQGMMRALAAYMPKLLPMIWGRLHYLMESLSEECFRMGGWVPLAVDGSRFSTPRSKSNETAFAAKDYGKGAYARSRVKWKNKKRRSKKLSTPVKPQVWMTLVFHMGLKLPWCWKTGPSTSSERHHFMEMLKVNLFPEKTLFCCDAGFVGYELWRSITDANHSFLIRVGANVRLLKNLGHARTGDGIVSLWPDSAARTKRPPIVLRLLVVQNSQGTMYLVTNVLNKRELSDAAVAKLYPLRWGVELQFRSTKQTFGRGKLRCRNADHVLAELDCSMVALTVIQLFAIKEQIQLDMPPDRMSVAAALRAVRDAMNNWLEPASGEESLKHQLLEAIVDSYDRQSKKQARYQPKYKDKPKVTKPIVKNASSRQKKNYHAFNMAT